MRIKVTAGIEGENILWIGNSNQLDLVLDGLLEANQTVIIESLEENSKGEKKGMKE